MPRMPLARENASKNAFLAGVHHFRRISLRTMRLWPILGAHFQLTLGRGASIACWSADRLQYVLSQTQPTRGVAAGTCWCRCSNPEFRVTPTPHIVGIRPVGDRAILVELPGLEAVLSLRAFLTDQPEEGQLDVVAAESTVLISAASTAAAARIARKVRVAELSTPKRRDDAVVVIDTVYDGEDLGGGRVGRHDIAAIGTLLTGRPVRVRLNRTLDMTMTGKRHGFHTSWEAGFTSDGKLLALKAMLTADGGWCLDMSEAVLARALCHVDNNYFIPNVHVDGRVAKSNKTSQTAFRGFGGPQGMLVIEDILGRSAPLLGLAPEDLRRKNFYREGDSTPYGMPVRYADRVTTLWEQVLERSGFSERRREIDAFNAAHPHRKRGLAVTPVKFGISFNLVAFNQAGALVHVYKDGSVLISHGGTEMGQGLHTKMLQVAATALGIPLSVSGWLPPAPTRCQTPRPPLPARVPISTVAPSRTPVSKSLSGYRPSPAACSASPAAMSAFPTAW